MELTNIKWDYSESVKMMQQTVYQWKNLTADIVKELWIARENLSDSGHRTDLVADATRSSWSTYCREIGIDRSTAHRWLERYLPEENKLLTFDEFQEIKRIEHQKKQSDAIKNFDDDAFQKRKEEFFADKISKILPKTDYKKTDDLFEKLQTNIHTAQETINTYLNAEISKEEKRKQLRISHNDEIIDQDIYFESFRDYLYQYDNKNRRLEVIQNFIKYLKNLAIECQRGI